MGAFMDGRRVPPSAVGVAGLVLAGGASTRMGTDKATLRFDKDLLVMRAVTALRDAGVENVQVVGGAAAAITERGLSYVPDRWPGQGPLAGIATGLHALAKDASNADVSGAFILACDLPFIDGSVVSSVIAAASPDDHGSIGHDGERVQPLCVFLRRAAFGAILEAFAEGETSPAAVFEGLTLAVAAPCDDGRLHDIDTPAELARARHEVAGDNEFNGATG